MMTTTTANFVNMFKNLTQAKMNVAEGNDYNKNAFLYNLLLVYPENDSHFEITALIMWKSLDEYLFNLL